MGDQAITQQVEPGGSSPSEKVEGARSVTQDSRRQGPSEVELMLEEEKGQSEALTGYLRSVLQDDCETSLHRRLSPPSSAADRAASFAFTNRLTNLKNGF